MYFNNLLFNTPNIKYFILIYIALKLYKQYNQIIYPKKKKPHLVVRTATNPSNL